MTAHVRRGVIAGLVMATVYAAVALVSLAAGPGAHDRAGRSLGTIVLTYYAAGALGGLAVGLMAPLRRSLSGMIAIGLVVAFIIFFCIETATTGPVWEWPERSWENVGFLTAFFGVAGAITWRKAFR